MPRTHLTCSLCDFYFADIRSCSCKGPEWERHDPCDIACTDFKNKEVCPVFKSPKSPTNKHYRFIPCSSDEYGMNLLFSSKEDEPEDGAWNWWMDKDGNVEFARFKFDAYDHFFPSTRYLNLGDDGIYEASHLAGYFKEVK